MKIPIKNEPTIFHNKDFQTIQIKVVFPFYKKEEEIAKINMIPSMLHYVCEKYPTEEELILECEKKYVLASFCNCNTIGNIAYFIFNMMIPDTKTMKENLLEEQFKILHEIIYHPKTENNHFCEKELEREINNTKNSIEKNLTDTNFYALLKAKEIVDTKHFFSNTIYNHKEQLDEINTQNLYDFYLDKIKNNQPTIYVFGNITKKEIEPLCKKYIYQKEYKNTYIETKIRHYIPIRNEIQDIKEQSSFHNSVFITFYKIKNMKRKKEVYLGIIKELLSSNTSRLLSKKLRDETELVYSTFALCYPNYGLFGICSMINKNNIELVREKTKEVIEQLKNEKEIEPLLQNIKERHRVNLLRLLDDKTSLFQEKMVKDLKIDITSEEYYKEILPITAKDIHKFVEDLCVDTY